MKRILSDGRSVRAVWRKRNTTTYSGASQTIKGLANNELPDIRLRALNEETLRAFMPIFRERLQKNLAEHHIGHEGDLDESLRFTVQKTSDGVMGTLRFNFYGRFVDWGVGKGTTLLEAQTGVALSAGRLTARRRAKPWFGPQYAHEQQRLRELATANVQQLVAEMAAMNIKIEIPL